MDVRTNRIKSIQSESAKTVHDALARQPKASSFFRLARLNELIDGPAKVSCVDNQEQVSISLFEGARLRKDCEKYNQHKSSKHPFYAFANSLAFRIQGVR